MAASRSRSNGRREKSRSPVGRPRAGTVSVDTKDIINIFLFIPNLIGYSRVILAGAALYFMSYHPNYCAVLYAVSCLLDAFDGWAARRFNQSTKFGAVLDMVTDRCTTACLLVFLSAVYSRWAVVFQILISLDLASHYMHMYASLDAGATSHKKVTKERSWILNLYYTNNKVLFTLCAANEICFVALYLMSFPQYQTEAAVNWPTWVFQATFLPCALKQYLNVLQMYKAARTLAESDVLNRRAAKLN